MYCAWVVVGALFVIEATIFDASGQAHVVNAGAGSTCVCRFAFLVTITASRDGLVHAFVCLLVALVRSTGVVVPALFIGRAAVCDG